jgi:DNA repair protein RadC
MIASTASPRPGKSGFAIRGVFALEDLSEEDILTRLLVASRGRRAPETARALLDRFGTLRGVLTAEAATLASLVGTCAAADLGMVHGLACRLAAAEIPPRAVISSWSALSTYLKVSMAHRTREAFRVLFLNKKNQLIADEVLTEGTVDHAPVYPREVMRRALELSASALILVHNHPSGDPTPSSADIDMTRDLIEAARALNLRVHDHVVVGASSLASFKALGLL